MCSLLLTVALSAWLTVTMAFVGRDVVVPEVTGRTPAEARETLDKLGLDLVVEDERHTDRESAGVIFYQQPLAGSVLKKGRSLRVLVSLGARATRVPRLEGRDFREASALIQDNGLRLGEVSYVHSLDVPEDRVLAQTPEGGAHGAQSERVDLLVSLGPRRWRFVMPDLTGRPLDLVQDVLESHGLRVGSVEKKYVMGTRGGLVIGQYPPEGTRIFQGSTISLVVSRDLGEGKGEGVQTEDLLVF